MTRYCVCIPARDEAKRLPVLLDALAAQAIDGTVPVAICLNNTHDDSIAAIAAAQTRHAARLAIVVACHDLPPPRAHAGTARGLAMDAGLARVEPSAGVLISTDADCRPPADWIAATLRAIDAGADMVGGRIAIDEAEPLAGALAAIRIATDAYWHAVRDIEDAIDPNPADPPPRHGDHTGASLAITAALYRTIGGVPPLPSGEDRAMVANGLAARGRLVHPMTVWTRTSPRRVGRAQGGMAHEMARLEALAAAGTPLCLPSFDAWRARAAWRRDMRALNGDAAVVEAERALPPMPCDMVVAP